MANRMAAQNNLVGVGIEVKAQSHGLFWVLVFINLKKRLS